MVGVAWVIGPGVVKVIIWLGCSDRGRIESRLLGRTLPDRLKNYREEELADQLRYFNLSS